MHIYAPALGIVCASLSACTSAPAQAPSAASPSNAQTPADANAGPQGYYREPAIHGDTIVLCAEGDLWRVPLAGGVATRITSSPGAEEGPAISTDGQWLAFTAEYEGPTEVYVMPLSGGLPRRLTWDDRPAATVAGWRGDQIIATTDRFSTLPSWQLTLINPPSGARNLVPLAQAADGSYSDDGKTLFFTRLQFNGSHSKRYKGGTTENLWRFSEGDAEATPLTSDFPGTSASPMYWSGRVYFASDRDGTMEIWSMSPNGKDLRQHTHHDDLDIKSPSLQAGGAGLIVFQFGADIHVYDIAANTERTIDITLSSDFDQTREKWITKPQGWISSSHVSPDGQRVAMTARGRVFVAPRGQGRLVDVTPQSGVRHREARFLPDNKTLVTLSDQAPAGEIGEVELWTLPANGVGGTTQLTHDGDSLRWEAVPSPDGKWIAHHDKNLRLWLCNMDTKLNKQVDETNSDNPFEDLAWSPDSRWLAYVFTAQNLNRQIKLLNVETGATALVTTDRYDSSSPAWSPDGRWLYLLSERNLNSTVNSPWGRLQPEPYFDRRSKVYQISLQPGTRSPFAPEDELHPEKKDQKKDGATRPAAASEPATQPTSAPASEPAGSPTSAPSKNTAASAEPIEIDLTNIASRLLEIPLPPGNYAQLSVTEKRLLWIQRSTEEGVKPSLMSADIARKDVKPAVLAKDVGSYELSQDGKSLLLRRDGALLIIDADSKAGASLDDAAVNLAGWTFPLVPREEWRQMFIEAWRLERDYFYDRNMVNVNWKLMLKKYLPLVDRVATRDDLGDLISQMVGELSTLHTFVRGGDLRTAENVAQPASLGAILVRDEAAGGFLVKHIYIHDQDRPELTPPLARPDVNVVEGEVITAINGQPALSAPDASVLLRNQAGRQVLLTVKDARAQTRDVIAVPFSAGEESNLRYHEWEITRRTIVEKESDNDVGYVHLRAMGGGDFDDFAREFYPVFKRKGLIIDVRHNRGGNIDSWIISRLLRKAWFYWQPRIGTADWNMQYAFRGHVVVLCNEKTASDGEAFTEGVKRLKIGHVIGTRTWGGEVWLSSSNILVDRGIATAAETGVYGPDGIWLIEGHGVEPDQVVDNLPHATFEGDDAQLKAAIEYLKRKIETEPVQMPPAPPYPDLRWPRD